MKQSIIFDGFPRTIQQAEALLKFLKTNNFKTMVINFKAPKAILLNRILNRKLKENRPDDTREIFTTRFTQYQTLTIPTIKFLQTHCSNFINLSATSSISSIQKKIVVLAQNFILSQEMDIQ